MARASAPPVVPWRTAMRERHVAAPRTAAWGALLDVVGPDADALSVEPPWRLVRLQAVPGIERCETTVVIRDDGDRCHLAWSVGLAAEPDDATVDDVVVRMAADGERLLEQIAERTTDG